MADIVHADHVKRTPVPKDLRTPDKDEAARWIESMWDSDTTLTDIAEASGYSRQHVSNTLKQYFEIASDDATASAPDATHMSGATVELDMTTLVHVFREAYQLGRRDERKLQNGEELELPDDGYAALMGVGDNAR
jgi:hypothetical protein